MQCLKSVVLSGWNPPPASRRFVGDLLYVEVRTLDDTLLHITASPNGFYLNK
jgi:protein TIF31